MFEAFYEKFPIDYNALEQYKKSIDMTVFPRGFMKTFEGMEPEQRQKWWEARWRCLKYPLFLGGFMPVEKTGDEHLDVEYTPIMGMDFQENPHSMLFNEFVHFRPGEGVVLSDLDQRYKKRMILWPRGLFKTSSIIVNIVSLIVNYPNVRICFLTGGDKLAARQLGRVKRVFEKPTPRFKFLFPDYCLKSVRNLKISDETDPRAWSDQLVRMGTQHEFTVPARTNDTFAEPTFCISTAKSVKAGSHFDVIFIDDLVNETNYRSIKLLEKVYQDYLDICPLLDPTGFMVVTGTRYSFGDTYERIQENAREEERKVGKTIWKFSIRDCWSTTCIHCNHPDIFHNREINILQPPCGHHGCDCRGFESDKVKSVLFPETRTHDGRSIGHTLEWLESERIRITPEFFANQYENQPIATGTQTFDEVMIGAITLHEVSQLPTYSEGVTFIIGDLAYVGMPGRDASVVYVVRMFRGRLYIIECQSGNWTSGAIAEITIKLLLMHRPNMIWYEKFNGWEAYDNVIRAKARELNVQNLPLEWLPMSQAPNAKLARIGSCHGPIKDKRLWIYGGIEGYATLVNQLVKWPKLGRHDDFADCLGMVVGAPTGYQLETPPQPQTTTNWLRTLHGATPVDDSYGDNGCGTGIVC